MSTMSDAPFIGILDNDPCAIDSIQRIISAYLQLAAHNETAQPTVWGTTFVTDAIDRARVGTGIVFLDMQLDGITGLHVAKRIHSVNADVTLIGITAYDPDVFLKYADQCGLTDVLDKATLRSSLPTMLSQYLAATSRTASEKRHVIPELTGSERSVLALSMRGLNSKQIAAAMGIADGTVFSHRHRIKEKFGLDSWEQVIEQCKIWNVI